MITKRELLMIHELKNEGLSTSEIARRLGLNRKTVRKYLQYDRNDLEALRRQPRPSKLDPYRPYLCRRLQEYPQLTARRLLREIQQRGYEGRYTLVVDVCTRDATVGLVRLNEPIHCSHFSHRALL